MRIIDKDNILPDSSVLEEVIVSHPFYDNLSAQLETVTIRRPSPSEGTHILTEGKAITLAIYPVDSIDDQYRYILYHEFGHVADRFNPAFKYSDAVRKSLSDRLKIIFVELWNLYIDARLNHLQIYRHSPGKFQRRVNNKVELVERTHENQLVERIDFLCKRGFSNGALVHEIWDHPDNKYSFNDLVNIAKQYTIEA